MATIRSVTLAVTTLVMLAIAACAGIAPSDSPDTRTASSSSPPAAPTGVLDAIKYHTGTMPKPASRVHVEGVQILPMVYDPYLNRDSDNAFSDEEKARLRSRLDSFQSKGVWGWGEAYRWTPTNPRVSRFCCLDDEKYHPSLHRLGSRRGSIRREVEYYQEIVETAKAAGPSWAAYGIWGLPTFEMLVKDTELPEQNHMQITALMQAVMPSCYVPDWKRSGIPYVSFPVPMIERLKRDTGGRVPIVAFVTRHKAGGHPRGRPNAPEARLSAADFEKYCRGVLEAGADYLALWESYQWDATQENEAAYRAMLEETLRIMVRVSAISEQQTPGPR